MEVITGAIRLQRLMVDICPFRIGSLVTVKPEHEYAADWQGIFVVVGLTWDYQKGDGSRINVWLASEDEIVYRNGPTDGWRVDDLLPESKRN